MRLPIWGLHNHRNLKKCIFGITCRLLIKTRIKCLLYYLPGHLDANSPALRRPLFTAGSTDPLSHNKRPVHAITAWLCQVLVARFIGWSSGLVERRLIETDGPAADYNTAAYPK